MPGVGLYVGPGQLTYQEQHSYGYRMPFIGRNIWIIQISFEDW